MSRSENDETRRDVSPPGWEGTTEAMKGHGEISNPFALAWWMQEQGFHPHDAMNKDVLDTAIEMAHKDGVFEIGGHEDGFTGEVAGAKEGNGESGDEYERETENLMPIPEEQSQMDDDDLEMGHEDPEEHAPLGGPGAHGMTTPYGMHGHASEPEGDDDEKLLDDSETAAGANYPTTEATTSDPSAASSEIGIHSAISDPAPDVSGAKPISVEGEETNDDDDDEDEEEEDDDY